MKNPTVLIVDDRPEGIESLRSVLMGHDYDILTAGGGREALGLIGSEHPDVVLLDVMMPEVDGFEVCRQVRDNPELAEIQILMITALDDRKSRLEGLRAGADDFLSKPVDREEVRLRVHLAAQLGRYRKLSTERALTDHIVNDSPDGILLLDQEGIIRLSNPAAHRLVGREDSLVGEPFLRFLEREDRVHWLQLVPDLHAASNGGSEELHLLSSGSEPTQVEVSMSRFTVEDEQGLLLTLRDVSERDRLRSTAKRSERMSHMGQAAAGIVHDFNNLFQAIRSNAEILLATLPEESPGRQDLQDIVGVTEDGVKLGKDMLLFARGGASQRSRVDLNQLLTDMEALLRHMVDRKAEVSVVPASHPAFVDADPAQLLQVVTNLVFNAAQAIDGSGGRIRVEVIAQENGGRDVSGFRVVDDGPGITPDVASRIFEPFFTTKAPEQGSGLGLSIANDIVKSHSGSIRVESTPGAGATFEVVLPRAR